MELTPSKIKEKQEAILKTLKSQYEGESITLTGPDVMWSNGPIHLSLLADVNNKNYSKKVPKGMSLYELQLLDRAVKSGNISLNSGLSKEELKRISNIKPESINDEQEVEVMTEIDYLLHLNIPGLEKELESIRNNNPNSADMFIQAYEEENTFRKREEYLKVLKSFLPDTK